MCFSSLFSAELLEEERIRTFCVMITGDRRPVFQNVAKLEDFSEKVAGLDKQRPAFLYCAKGGRSHQAAEIFKEQGFTEVYDLDGGYDACGQ